MAARTTQATKVAEKAGIAFVLHMYEHDPAAESYGLEAAEALGAPPEQVFKTLVVSVSDGFVVCVIPTSATLDLRSLGKRAAMAAIRDVERVTGYVAGGVSPLGQRRRLKTYLDESARAFSTIHISAGRRGLEMELSPHDLVELTGAAIRGLTRDTAR